MEAKVERRRPSLARAAFWFDDGAKVRGWTDGSEWNGWGIPLFDEQQLPDAIRALSAVGFSVRKRDSTLFLRYEDDDYESNYLAETIAGKRYWRVEGLTWNYEPNGGSRRVREAVGLPSVEDVAHDLRRVNKMTFSVAFREGTKLLVYLQIQDDGTWGVYTKPTTLGRWGSAAIPGNNRRFDAAAVARDLLAQVGGAGSGRVRSSGSVREDSYEVTTHIVGSKPERHSVSSLAAASAAARQAIDDAGIGASDMGRQHGVLKRNGRAIGRVAYNGRIFDLDDKIMWDNRTSPGVREDRFEKHGLSLAQSRELLAQEFDDWDESDGEDTLMPWMQTILEDAGVELEQAGVEAAAHEATEQIRNASPAQILEYMNERSEAINE